MYDQLQFLVDLDTFIGFKTCVDQNRDEFVQARAWIRAFFEPATTESIELTYEGFTSLIIKPKASSKPRFLGDGHIEVVPGGDQLFELRNIDGLLFGRGVADMKTQCLMMMWVQRELIATGKHNDFWLLLTEDEEIGSPNGVRRVVDYLSEHDLLPDRVFVPDGGPDFAYVEKEKGLIAFSVTIKGTAAHGSRPFLGENAIDRMMALYEQLKKRFPNPNNEQEWIPSLSMTRIAAGEGPRTAYNKIPDHCTAGFDLRFAEDYRAEEILDLLESIGSPFKARFEYRDVGLATYYPQERPLAQRYIDILRRVSGKEPEILHSNGASNGRFYVAKNSDVYILMSNPKVVGLHADIECVDSRSLEPYYRLVQETVLL
jgi:succinyl-diaminopimelate desuccinylase